jgi:hypothetical protein
MLSARSEKGIEWNLCPISVCYSAFCGKMVLVMCTKNYAETALSRPAAESSSEKTRCFYDLDNLSKCSALIVVPGYSISD